MNISIRYTLIADYGDAKAAIQTVINYFDAVRNRLAMMIELAVRHTGPKLGAGSVTTDFYINSGLPEQILKLSVGDSTIYDAIGQYIAGLIRSWSLETPELTFDVLLPSGPATAFIPIQGHNITLIPHEPLY